MTCKIGKVPGDRCVGSSDRIGAIDQRDIVEFGTAHPLWLQDPEQPGLMQIAFGLGRQTPQFLGPRRPIAQSWNQRFGAGDHRHIGAVVRIGPGGQV